MLKERVVVVREGLAFTTIEESWSNITDVLRKSVVVVGDNVALSVLVTKGRETDDICLAMEMTMYIAMCTMQVH